MGYGTHLRFYPEDVLYSVRCIVYTGWVKKVSCCTVTDISKAIQWS